MIAPTPPNLRLSETFDAADGIGLAVGFDHDGCYLVVSVPGRSGPCWICAPASERALDCVRRRRASPWAVVHHSRTGTVTVYRTLLDGSLRDSTVLCASLPAGTAVLCAA